MKLPEIAAKAPCAVPVEAGKTYWWCTCGRSRTQPFCDGAHHGSGFSPLQYTASESRVVHFCACKQTQDPPFCDGAHKAL